MRARDLRMGDLLQLEPSGGIIRFGGNRALLFDAVALGLLRSQLVEVFGLTAARGLLTRLGYSHGWRTAESLRDTIPWDDEREWRVAGGRLHRLQGLVSFEPVKVPRPDALAEAIWPDSYEAEQHVLHLGQATEPVCWSLTGFASGYLSHVTGEDVYAIEVTCCGQGDAVCRMLAKTRANWGDEIEPHLPFYEKDCLDASLEALRKSVRELDRTLRSRRRALGEDASALEIEGIVARSQAMRRVLDLSKRVASVDSTVLLSGESGVGKERVARFIHDHSLRASGPFVAINCAAIPEPLLESELFGHVKGAFTGANSDRAGIFEAAHGGTLLLDEIGDVPPALQVRLLRVLQEREVRRVGENQDRPVDIRVLAATHRNLRAEVDAGRFREDLLFRLNVVEISIPPLRDRPDDILPLARLKLLETATRFKPPVKDFSSAVAKQLIAHPWRGNVRELHNVIERAVVFAEGSQVDVADLQLEPATRPEPRPHGDGRTLDDVERAHILATLEAADGNRSEAARRLGIGAATLFRKLKRYGVVGPRQGRN
ncbi:MAG: sigma-54-dependent Fis family transcriptional regulator [Myxococcota bacterium]